VFQQHRTISVGAASIGANSCVRSTLTISGLQVGDLPMWTKTNADLPAGMQYEPERVLAANQLQGDFCNLTTGMLSAPAQTHTYASLR
jgi:hypothetical protein